MITGSAPIAKEVVNFLKIAFCTQIREGYGQTESAGALTVSWTYDPEAAHVGAPNPSVELKLIDVPDMNYRSTDGEESGHPIPRGELLYRGHSVCKGYYRQP
jgi:long-chain acyl-CoA synthetase